MKRLLGFVALTGAAIAALAVSRNASGGGTVDPGSLIPVSGRKRNIDDLIALMPSTPPTNWRDVLASIYTGSPSLDDWLYLRSQLHLAREVMVREGFHLDRAGQYETGFPTMIRLIQTGSGLMVAEF